MHSQKCKKKVLSRTNSGSFWVGKGSTQVKRLQEVLLAILIYSAVRSQMVRLILFGTWQKIVIFAYCSLFRLILHFLTLYFLSFSLRKCLLVCRKFEGMFRPKKVVNAVPPQATTSCSSWSFVAGDRDIQLWPGRSHDWRYIYPRLSVRNICLGRATSEFQEQIASFNHCEGTNQWKSFWCVHLISAKLYTQKVSCEGFILYICFPSEFPWARLSNGELVPWSSGICDHGRERATLLHSLLHMGFCQICGKSLRFCTI